MVPAHLNPLDVLLMVPCSQYTKPNYTKPACSKLCTIIVVYQDVNTCALKKKKNNKLFLIQLGNLLTLSLIKIYNTQKILNRFL